VALSITTEVVREGDIPLETIAAQFSRLLAEYLEESRLTEGGQLVSINRIIGLLIGCSGVADAGRITLNGGTASIRLEQGCYGTVGAVTLTEADHEAA